MGSLTKSLQPEKNKIIDSRPIFPLLPIRDVVLFPGMVLPIAVGREKSVKALEAAVELHGRRLFIVTQKSPQVEDPKPDELHDVGTVGEVVQVFKLPDNSVKTFVQGLYRAKITEFAATETNFAQVYIEPLVSAPLEETVVAEALTRQLKETFQQYVQLNPRLSPDLNQTIAQIAEPDRLADAVAANVTLKTQFKQELLETLDLQSRIEQLLGHIFREIEVLNLEKKIQARVRGQIDKNQKEFILNEQMKAIQKELKSRDDFTKEVEESREKIKACKMPKEAEEAASKELDRLSKMMPYSPEATVCRSYVDWMTALPWSKMTHDRLDLDRAQKVLEEDHFGLDKAKERILEYLAVSKLKRKLRGPILCFVGPPGVGKTSLARSIAHALGRKFVRVSLGGVRDESEVRGHRRTYIGALPGRLIQQVRKAKSRNPVFLLDEIDKMGTDWRGDPAAALLEVLDPEQNQSFLDHYLDVGFNLSDIFFIATANTTFSIPPTLIDRLEVIRFSGYTLKEKLEIAKRYLVPKQIKEHGLVKAADVTFGDDALTLIIERYTQEAGVRNLDREIARVCRKLAREVVSQKEKTSVVIGKSNVEKYLGVHKFKKGSRAQNGVGVATGLAWTEHGGELLTIEVASVPGKGDMILTGKLGSVMQESAQAAFSYVKSLSSELPFETKLLRSKDFHIHVPEGAVPKDGPSAGIALATALASFLSDRPIASSLAMTGEITLRGRVLPIGGLKEKLVAAHREGIKTVIIPKDNEKDLEEVPAEVKEQIKIVAVSAMDEVLKIALE